MDIRSVTLQARNVLIVRVLLTESITGEAKPQAVPRWVLSLWLPNASVELFDLSAIGCSATMVYIPNMNSMLNIKCYNIIPPALRTCQFPESKPHM